MGGVVTLVEPVVILNSIGCSFYDTALTMVVYSYSNRTAGGHSSEAQVLSARFFLVYDTLTCLTSLLSTALLGRLADSRGQKLLLVVPQVGSILGKTFLLLLLLLRLPLYTLHVGAVVHGLCGGSSAYWSGIDSLTALKSALKTRSLRLNSVDFFSGVAGMVGGFVSGYIYQVKAYDGEMGITSTLVGLLVIGAALLYSVFFLIYPAAGLSGSSSNSGSGGQLAPSGPAEPDKMAVALLFLSMVLFVLGMAGAENVLSLFVLKPPLNWDSVWVGYGQAATNMMYVTSFLGVLLLSRRISDTALILLGIVSNCTGMAMMAFARHSWLYFLARGVMMFACVPMPTIRSQLSKLLHTHTYGRAFGGLQSCLAVTSLLSTLLFANVYPLTLQCFSGSCFLLSAIISYLSAIPVLYLNCRRAEPRYMRISGRDNPEGPAGAETS
ncbi:thymic stromal cotransporter homolog [Polypterus senegalus]|uniref:thymic stromal cotransporter homolog n=1 Tax=Polypterus senegalus TaxID=55291 RepID=UPI0019646D76|nr:thymic stromal cotransporter homolog [Polypterus senegalus]